MRGSSIVASFLAMTMALLLPLAHAAPPLKVANGRVEEASLEKQELILSYRNPVSGETEALALRIDERTSFPQGNSFETLRAGLPVSVDYEEGGGVRRAVFIKPISEKFPVEKLSKPS